VCIFSVAQQQRKGCRVTKLDANLKAPCVYYSLAAHSNSGGRQLGARKKLRSTAGGERVHYNSHAISAHEKIASKIHARRRRKRARAVMTCGPSQPGNPPERFAGWKHTKNCELQTSAPRDYPPQ
jgi:hypothetical protein